MTDFTITIKDVSMLLGIAAAREAHNRDLPGTIDADGKEVVPLGFVKTDLAFLQKLVEGMANTWVHEFDTDIVAIDRKMAELKDKRKAMLAKK